MSVKICPRRNIVSCEMNKFYSFRKYSIHFRVNFHNCKYLYFHRYQVLDKKVYRRPGRRLTWAHCNSWNHAHHVLFLVGRDQPTGECHRDDAADQWQDQQHGPAAPGWPGPAHQSPVHAPEWHCGSRCHGWFCQLWEGTWHTWDGLRISKLHPWDPKTILKSHPHFPELLGPLRT